MSLPFFSILICNYNYERFVGEAIDSALAQDYPTECFEIIVVDDGSTDRSRSVITAHAGDRVRVIHQPNRGQSAAFEAGVAVARGDFVCLLDSDDIYLPHKLARVAARLAQLPAGGHDVFLCHDLFVEDSLANQRSAQTWFANVGVASSEMERTVQATTAHFPFSIPSGLVLSRSLCERFFASLPAWSFTRGADGVLCPAALIACGVVYYLHECLSVYRMHGDNEFGNVVDGRYTPRFDPRVRAPKTLRFLEQWVDVLPLEDAARVAALAYLRRLEHLNRRPSESRRLLDAQVSMIIFGTGDAGHMAASIEAAAQQSHAAIELVLPEGVEPGAAVVSSGRSVRRFADDGMRADAERFTRALGACTGSWVVFVRAGDVLDRDFVQRHLHLHQHGALVGVSCCDVRLIDEAGALLHADVFSHSGAWKQAVQHIPPLAAGLRDWVGSPMSACLFRRHELLERLLADSALIDDDLRAAVFWLALQFAQQTAGLLRVRESMVSIRIGDGAAASYGYAGSPAGLNGGLIAMQPREAALWLQEFYLDHEAVFRRCLPTAWHLAFEPWLDAHTKQQASA